MKTAAAIVLGFFSGSLMYMGTAFVLLGHVSERTLIAIGVGAFFAGWAIPAVLMLEGAPRVSQVLRRGFLLGAVEWAAMVPVGFISFSARVSATRPPTMVTGIARVVGGGLAMAVLAIPMAVICLICFGVVYFIERHSERAMQCPFCAETIKAAATKCRFCGSPLYRAQPLPLPPQSV